MTSTFSLISARCGSASMENPAFAVHRSGLLFCFNLNPSVSGWGLMAAFTLSLHDPDNRLTTAFYDDTLHPNDLMRAGFQPLVRLQRAMKRLS